MKLFSAIIAGIRSFEGKVKQKQLIVAKFISLVALGAVLSGFFYCLFLTSSDFVQFTDRTNDPVLKTFGSLIEKVQAKEKAAEPDPAPPKCDELPPVILTTNPTSPAFKLENMCYRTIPNETEIAPEKTEEEIEREDLARELEPILKGTPMEQMIGPISTQQRIVAAYLVGIAKKESQLGKYAPSKNGADCFNYWGYKGNEDPVAGGYSCFSSPEQAVRTVGKRLEKFAIQQNRDTPEKMIIWKCGSSCQTHSQTSVAKWISDVSGYFFKIYPPETAKTRG